MLACQPEHADGQRRLVSCRGAQFARFIDAARDTQILPARRGGAHHGARSDPHCGPIRIIGRQLIGDLTGTLPTDPRRGDVAPGRPRTRAHAPAVGGREIACGLQVLGDQRGVLVSRFRVTRLDGECDAPVHRGAIGFELRFVGHRTNQRVVEDILGLSGKGDLIDEIAAQQALEDSINPERFQ